jgi:hypothetical protein
MLNWLTLIEFRKNEWGLLMNKKGISKLVIVVIIVVAVLVVGVVAYLGMSGGGGDNGTGDNGGNGGGGNGGGNGGTTTDVAGASSLQFSVSFTEAGVGTDVSTYRVKNAGTSSVMMRIDTALATGEDFIYIINGAQQKVWIYGDGEWMDLSVNYDTYWAQWSTTWEGYRDSLSDWTGLGDWSYTEGGATIRIYDIDVNPSLADSLFEH